MKKYKPQDFAVFILTNRRPDNVKTVQTLKRHGYTGKVYIIIDDLDPTRDEYIKRYGDSVVVFDKKEIAKTFDQGDNFSDMRTIIYARNASFKIAKDLGIKYFIQLDDDYTNFQYRFGANLDYEYKGIKNLDRIFHLMLEFYKSTPISSIAMAQGGDFIGGSESDMAQRVFFKRKCMNSFICSTDRPFQFIGRINEDVNTYVSQGSKGLLFFTTNQVCLVQTATQKNPGGMADMYLDSGTYVKSFYSVIYEPSSVKVKMMYSKHSRLHHSISWKNAVPLILREDLKKV